MFLYFQEKFYYTDFQPHNAHHLFPCFDQPDLRSEISLLLTIPNEWAAFGCTNSKKILIDKNFEKENENSNIYKLLDIQKPESKN